MMEHTIDKIGKRINDVLSDYSHTPETEAVRIDFNTLLERVDTLLPPSAEKIYLFRAFLTAAHHLADAVEMRR